MRCRILSPTRDANGANRTEISRPFEKGLSYLARLEEVPAGRPSKQAHLRAARPAAMAAFHLLEVKHASISYARMYASMQAQGGGDCGTRLRAQIYNAFGLFTIRVLSSLLSPI
jgi:hypothetical protein